MELALRAAGLVGLRREMKDSTGVNESHVPQVKAPVCGFHDKFDVLPNNKASFFLMQERETDLVTLIGFFTAILGRCVGIGVFLFCAVVTLYDNFRLGRRTDRRKEVVVCCLRRLDEGNAILESM